ncbi:hypothetical protein [Comamonas testosteroni]|uniref:Lipoprotein n=1 Tax=Comamonas testosteroni TaxID=285 RepID=A0A096FNU5_COMTE|nr:hypothetical protein [Comamonas testosteroni]KGH31443.1 hypothetical protein P353_05545 [Comamonas testosteroni]
MKNASITAVLALALGLLAGCSQEGGSADSKADQQAPQAAQLDEAGMIAAVGRPVVSETRLNDGKGYSFLTDKCGKSVCGPEFGLEFRKGRVSVYWEFFRDDDGETFEAMNAENLQLAAQVLTYALGEDSARQLLESVKNGEPVRDGKFAGKRVGLSTGPTSALVQIFP